MKKHETGKRVYLIGTQKSLYNRTVYTDGNAYYIKWYGGYIEVLKNEVYGNYYTVEAY